MRKLKIGDKVKFIKPTSGIGIDEFFIGKTGVIIKVAYGSVYDYTIRMDCDGMDNTTRESHISLIDPIIKLAERYGF